MSDTLKKVLEERQRAVHQMREILDRQTKGEPRAEDEAAFTKASDDVTRLKTQIDALYAAEQDEAKYAERANATEAEIREQVTEAFQAAGPQTPEARSKWEAELRETIKAERRRMGEGTESAPNLRALLKAAKEERTTLVGSGGTAAPTVPTEFSSELFSKIFLNGNLLQAGVRLVQTGDGRPLTLVRKSARNSEIDSGGGGTTAVRRAEAGTIHTNAGPAFDQIVLNAYSYGEIQQVSREALEDSQFDLRGLLAEQIGENIANYLDTDMTNGAGTTGIPRGLLTIVGSNVVNGKNTLTGNLGGLQGFDELLDVEYKLTPAYRNRGTFIMSDLGVKQVRKLRRNPTATDITNNDYAWQPSQTLGGPDTLDGHPVYVDPFMPDPAVSKVWLVFADLSKMIVRMVNSVRVEWSTEYAWDQDLVSVRALVRADADSVDDTAFTGFKGGTA